MGAYKAGEEAVGLRIIYGALRTTCKTAEYWKVFYKRFKSLKEMTVLEAVRFLRAFGKDRMILIGMDN